LFQHKVKVVFHVIYFSLFLGYRASFFRPYVLCFNTKLKVREGHASVRVVPFSIYFCIQKYFWRFFVIYIHLFFDVPDSEISGQYASILQSLWGRQDGMLDPQVQQRFYQAY